MVMSCIDMKIHFSAIVILCTAGVSCLHAYTSQNVSNTVSSFITAPTYFSLQGQTLASPTNQYSATWTGEALLATNGSFTGKGVIIAFSNGSTNSSKNSFKITSPSLIKGAVLLETYTTVTSQDSWTNHYNPFNSNDTIVVNYTYSNTKYLYSADCILNATNATNTFLLKGRILYPVSVYTEAQPATYVVPGYTNNGNIFYGYTNNGFTNISTNIGTVSLSLAAFSTNNVFWGFVSGYNVSPFNPWGYNQVGGF